MSEYTSLKTWQDWLEFLCMILKCVLYLYDKQYYYLTTRESMMDRAYIFSKC
jgi:hypothetical protein